MKLITTALQAHKRPLPQPNITKQIFELNRLLGGKAGTHPIKNVQNMLLKFQNRPFDYLETLRTTPGLKEKLHLLAEYNLPHSQEQARCIALCKALLNQSVLNLYWSTPCYLDKNSFDKHLRYALSHTPPKDNIAILKISGTFNYPLGDVFVLLKCIQEHPMLSQIKGVDLSQAQLPKPSQEVKYAFQLQLHPHHDLYSKTASQMREEALQLRESRYRPSSESLFGPLFQQISSVESGFFERQPS